MVSPINYLLGSELTVGTAGSLVNNARLVRVYNNAGADVLVTVKASDGVTVTGTMTVKSGDTVYVQKGGQESIFAASNVKMVSVGF